MGEEGKIIEFMSPYQTYVFWNMDDYPVGADDDDLSSIRSNIEKALNKLGFHGQMFVNVYSSKEQPECRKQEMSKALIFYLPICTREYNKNSAALPTLDMTYFILFISEDSGQGYGDVVVIAKPYRELNRVMESLHNRKHNVLIIDPTSAEGSIFSVDSLVDNARLFSGAKPRSREVVPCDFLVTWSIRIPVFDSEEEEDLSKIVDFSEAVRPDKGARTVIFWDAEDCPFPPSLTPDEIYQAIKSDHMERGFTDKISVWAYLDEDKKGSDKFLGAKEWDSRIYFLPGGDKGSRRIRMLNDMYLLSRDSGVCRPSEAYLILVSDQFMGDRLYIETFKILRSRGYYLLVVIPSDEHIKKWDGGDGGWKIRPGDLFDGGYGLDVKTSESSDEPCPKMHKANEEESTLGVGTS